MERLTVNKLGNLLIKEADGEYRSPCYGCENINFCKPEKERVCGLYKALDKLKEYEDLEEQGLLLKLPCKVGDTVWYINERVEKQGRKKVTVFFIDDGRVDNITLGSVMIPQIEVCNSKENSWITFDCKEDWNKIVFLTQEEAEEALKI